MSNEINKPEYVYEIRFGAPGTNRDDWQAVADPSAGEETPAPLLWPDGRSAAENVETFKNYPHLRELYGIPEGAALAVHRVAKTPLDDGGAWRERERERFASGRYKPVPWANDAEIMAMIPDFHFCHISENDTQKVAFTETIEKGIADRQRVLRPNEYLGRYTNASQEKIDDYVAQITGDSIKVLFASTPDEIEAAYIRCYTQGGDMGVYSCMAYHANHFSSHIHPARVYGAGDLALAYIENDDGKIIARAMVWPEQNACGRLYGIGHYELRAGLRRAGYTAFSNYSLEGARLLKIPAEGRSNGAYVMPYIDGNQTFDDAGEYFTIGGDYDANRTDGLAYCVELFTCECCDERYSENEMQSVDDEYWCNSCVENHAFTCEHCEETHRDYQARSVITSPRGYTETWCESCQENHAVYSSHHSEYISDELAVCCDECNEYFLPRDMTTHNDCDVCEDCREHLAEAEAEAETETETETEAEGAE